MASGKNRAKAAGRFTGKTSYSVTPGGSPKPYVPPKPTAPVWSGSGRLPTSRVPETRAAGAAQQAYADSKPISSLGDPTAGAGGLSGLDETLLGIPVPGSGSGGGGGGGGGGGRSSGGGGAGGGVSPAMANAYKAVWNQQMGNAVNLNQGWDQYEDRLGKAYDPGRINEVFDTAQTGVQDASKAGLDRLGPILQGLRDRAATARTGVNDAFAASDARLAQLGAEYGGRQQAATAGLNNVLGAFDAGEVASTQESLAGLMANARLGNEGFRRTMDVGLADRPAVYEGLNADVQSGMARDEAGLLNRVAMQRAGSLNQNESALQQALAQAGLGRLTAEQQRQAEQNQLRIELAQLGLIPPDSFTGSWNA